MSWAWLRRACVAGYVVALLWTACGACAADLSAVGEVVEQLDTEPLARFLRQLDEEMYPVMPDFAVERIVADPGYLFDPQQMLYSAGAFLAREVVANLGMLGALVTMAVLTAALDAVAAGVAHRAPAVTDQAVCRIILVIVVVTAFHRSASVGLETVENMMGLIYALMPSLVTAMAASGGIVTAAVASPLMVAAAAAMGALVRSWVVPMLLMSTVLSLVGDLGGRRQVARLAAVMRQWALLVLIRLHVRRGHHGSRRHREGVGRRPGRAAVLTGSICRWWAVFSDAIDVIAASSGLVRGALVPSACGAGGPMPVSAKLRMQG